MSRLTETVRRLEKQYNFNIDDLLDLYKRKLSRREIGEKLGLSTFNTRKIMERLDLPPKKHLRAEAYIKFVVELSTDKEVEEEIKEAPVKENLYLHKQLAVSQRGLQRARDENNHLRSVIRNSVRSDSLQEQALDLIEQALPIKDKRDISITIESTLSDKYKDHVSCLLLSDLHVEEFLDRKAMGNLNEFNWEIMENRLETLFLTWFNLYRGEKRAVVMILGDVISGIIHDTLESTTKPTAEAIHDLADLLSGYFKTAGVIFDDVDIHFVSGNHERLSERVKSTNKGFDLGYLFGQILKAKLSDMQNITVDVSTTGFTATQIGDKWLGGHHGDQFRGAKNPARTAIIQDAFKKVLGVEVWHIFEGHSHNYSHTNSNRGSNINNGSLVGSNPYGLTSGFESIRPSQTIVMFEPSGEIEFVKQVFLDV